MRKAILITGIVMLILFITSIIVITNSKQQYVEDYLNGRYEFEYTYIDTLKHDKVTTYTFSIKDERKLEFQVDYQWGKLNTPMGPTIIPIRKCTDNLSQSFFEYVVEDTTPYSIDDKTVDDIYIYIDSTIEQVDLLRDEYGVYGYTDDYIFEFLLKGNIIEFKYNQSTGGESYIKSMIEDVLIQNIWFL